MKTLEQLSDQDALEIFDIFGGSAISNEAKIFQVKDILATNKFYNTQTNIPGSYWIKIFNCLRSKGYSLPYESPSTDVSGLREALERIESAEVPEEEEFTFDPGQFIYELKGMARKALAQYSTLTAPADETEGSISEGEEDDQETLWDELFDQIVWDERESNSDVKQIEKSLQRKYHITKKQ